MALNTLRAHLRARLSEVNSESLQCSVPVITSSIFHLRCRRLIVTSAQISVRSTESVLFDPLVWPSTRIPPRTGRARGAPAQPHTI